MEILEGRGIEYVVDATGKLLKNVLKYRPFFIKPNKKDMEELLGDIIYTDEDLKRGAEAMQTIGARNLHVALGTDGAYLLWADGTEHMKAAVCDDNAVNTVGAGD